MSTRARNTTSVHPAWQLTDLPLEMPLVDLAVLGFARFCYDAGTAPGG